ncbi:hypothetical protein [Bacteroides pyogenes]|nr:hypothetical protein [Bacteroides pyogenes]
MSSESMGSAGSSGYCSLKKLAVVGSESMGSAGSSDCRSLK